MPATPQAQNPRRLSPQAPSLAGAFGDSTPGSVAIWARRSDRTMAPSRCVPDCGGNEPPIRAAIPVSLAALSVPGSPSFALPIRGLILMRVAVFCGAVVSLTGCPEGWRLRGDERGAEGRCGAGCGGMDCRNGESQNRAVLRTGSIETRHPRLGAAGIPW